MGRALAAKVLIICLAACVWGQSLPLDRRPPKYPAGERGEGPDAREPSSADKLAPELQVLSEQFAPTRGGEAGAREDGVGGYTAKQLGEIFGIEGATDNPLVHIVVEVTPQTKAEDLRRAGAKVYFRLGSTVYARAPVSALSALSRSAAVKRVGLLKPLGMPAPPPSRDAPMFDFPARGGEEPVAPGEFDRQRLTGEGVIVGVVDSGIDWTHPDFIRADGTTRVLLLWDLTDDSWRVSAGTVGTSPPTLGEGAEPLPGTVYTAAQLNAALKGQGRVNSTDKVGHGTAVAGTAAGSGRGAAGALSSVYQGVAPGADLIVVKVGDCEKSVSVLAAVGAYWAAAQARQLKRSAVINLSLGSHYNAHDGGSEEERLLDAIADAAGGLGVPVVVAAGNEGRQSLHAGGRFGPRRPEQVDVASQPIEANLSQPSLLLGSFAARDDWGLFFRGTNRLFLGRDGKPVGVFVHKTDGKVRIETEAPVADEASFKQFLQSTRPAGQGASDTLVMQLPAGQYLFFGFGATANVPDGRFSLYLPDADGGSFGLGAEKRHMVSSPGNASGVITVGSIDFRSEWENEVGRISRFNLSAGEISDYSSPGPRRDGLTKPEVVAPGRYTLAALSRFSAPENGGCKGSMVADEGQRKTFVTRGGSHLAWSGTSAAAPFVTGLVALMLQKNPNLKAEQIKQILIKTASGRTTDGRAVNDERLGYGRVEPAAALRAVPPASRPRPATRRR